MPRNEPANQWTGHVADVSGRTHPRPERNRRKINHLTPKVRWGVPSRGHSYRTLRRQTAHAGPLSPPASPWRDSPRRWGWAVNIDATNRQRETRPMNCVGHGIDLVEVSRMRRILERHGARLTERCFSTDERAYCDRQARRRAEHYAARFAAKEAVLKALGTGWTDGINWTDVQVLRDASGRPGVQLCGRAAEIADQRGIGSWLVSLTHTADLAGASVIALSDRSNR